MRACTEAFGRTVLNLGESDVTYSIAPLHHAYGLGGGLYFPFAAGATTVLSPVPPQPRSVLHTIRGYRPTVLFGVPSNYASILAAGGSRLTADAFDSLRLCISAGEPLAASLLERWRDTTGLDIIDGVGSTESCHTYISNRADDIRPGSSGTLVEGYLARVVGEDGRDLPPGEPGRLLVTGESLFAGYWRRRELTRRAMLGEWLDTGDIYVADEAGYFTFQGRADEMLKVAGAWVSPAEVESVLVETGLVDECAVVGVQDAFSLVRLMAFVVPRADGDQGDYEELERALRQDVRQRLGNTKVPRVFRFVDELPRTASGKVHRSPLREQARVPATS
jgi:acyl-coenzyme A synthetase/AMP-(fatty) acid ligase